MSVGGVIVPASLGRAKQWGDNHPDQALLIASDSWNEWTEGLYLLPDMRLGYAYLWAVRRVFG